MGDPFDVNDALAEIISRKEADPAMRDVISLTQTYSPDDNTVKDVLSSLKDALGESIDSLEEKSDAFKEGHALGVKEVSIADPKDSAFNRNQYQDETDSLDYASGYIAGRIHGIAQMRSKDSAQDGRGKKAKTNKQKKGVSPLEGTAFLDFPYGKVFAIVSAYILALVLAGIFWQYAKW